MPESLDLDALREAVDLYLDPERAPARPTTLAWPVTQLDAVLALVDEQRARISTLEEALRYIGDFARAHHHQQPGHVLLHGLTIDIPEIVAEALAVSPAENKEP